MFVRAPSPEVRIEIAARRLPVSLIDPLGASLVNTGSAAPLCLDLHQPLQHVLPQLPEKVPVRMLLSEFQECHAVVGHRGVLP